VVSQSKHPRDSAGEDLDDALSLLDLGHGPDPAGVDPTAPIKEAIEAHRKANPGWDEPELEADSAGPAPETDADDARLGAIRTVRDAFGNRRRSGEQEGQGTDELGQRIAMYGLPRDLSRQVLSGRLKLVTALKLHRDRKSAARKAPSEYRRVWTIAFAVLLLVAAATLLPALLR